MLEVIQYITEIIICNRPEIIFIRFDWRLKFVNLKKDAKKANIIEQDERKEIWIPNLVFHNSIKDSQVANDEFSTLMINQVNVTKHFTIIVFMTLQD